MSRTGKGFAIGLLTGLAAGTVTALLLAPDKGKNTRSRISYRINSYIEDLNGLIDQLRKEKDKITSQAKEDGNKVVEDAKQRADDLIKEAESLLENIERSKRN
ncbi:MAG: YtxH domain-containing protein [Balneolaceae bacterium]